MPSAIRVLLVEDEPGTALIVERRLRSVESVACDVRIAGTLGEALSCLGSASYDLVIADLHLPDSPGEQTIAALVSACEQPVIALTADESPGMRARALASGAYDFLIKGQLKEGALERLVRLAALQANTFHSLRESESRFRSLVALSSDFYWETDVEHRVILTTHDQKYEPASQSQIGKRRWELPSTHPDAAGWAAHRAALEARQAFRDFEIGRIDPHGARRFLSISGEPVHGPRGEFHGYRGVGRDISGRRREERLVALEHQVVRELADAVTVPGALNEVMRAICRSELWQCCLYFSADEGAGGMRCESAWCEPQSPMQAFVDGSKDLVFARGVGLIGSVWQSGAPLWVADATSDSRVHAKALARELGIHGAFVLPLTFAGRMVGVLSFASSTVREPDARLMETMGAVGSQIAQFLQRKQVEERLEAGFEHLGEMIALTDKEERIVVANRRFREFNAGVAEFVMPGRRYDEHLRAGAERGLFPGAVGREEEWVAERMAQRRNPAGPLERQRQDGRWLLVDDQRLPDGSTISFGLEITERKRAEKALRESEERYRRTFELAASGIAHIGLDRRFVRVNARLCEILGYSEAELLCLTGRQISHPDDLDVINQQRPRLYANEIDSVRTEKRYLRKDGSTVWVNLTVSLVRDERGAPSYEISVIEDISQQKEREAALQRFRTALDASADMVYLFEMDGGSLLDFNQTACASLGYTREELLRLRARDIRVGVTPEALRAEIDQLLASVGRSNSVITEYRRKDGSSFPVESRRSMLDTPQGRVLVVNSRDLTERRSAEQRRAMQARYQKKIARLGQAALTHRDAAQFIQKAVQSVLEGLGGGAVAYVERAPGERQVVLRRAAGLAGVVTDAQSSFEAGSPVEQVLERSQHIVLSAPWNSGAPLPFDWAAGFAAAALVPVPGGLGARGALCALSEQAGALGPEEARFLGAAASLLSAALHRFDSEARLAYLAQFDTLTGLPNRALLSDRFSQMAEQARRRGATLGVLFIDLDEFKMVNDTQGHAAGDELLREVARRLKGAVRPGDTVARISGDEFAVVLVDLARPDNAALVAQKILDRLAEPVAIAGQESFITASIGIATFPADGKDAEELLGAADAAMYRAKQAGRGGFQFFTVEINQRTRARAQLGVELRRALEHKEFTLAYQPKIDLASGIPCGVEALLRWEQSGRSAVPPVEFIPVLEETGLIVAVGEWVLRRACDDLKAWQKQGLPLLPVAVNISARQFRQLDLDTRIRHVVKSAGVNPALLELEITESQLMHDPEHAVRMLRALGSAGLRIAVDDFGTGYSSLAYLTRFPLTALKIDKSFVDGVLTDAADATIVRTIIEMAHTLGFTVVAEGVETAPQAAFLRALGCEQAQGYFFARPMPAADLERFLSAPKPAAAKRRRRLRQKAS